MCVLYTLHGSVFMCVCLCVCVCCVSQYCRHGMCVNKELDLRPVHGEWGTWGLYSVCSRTCGGGTRSTFRECNKPV